VISASAELIRTSAVSLRPSTIAYLGFLVCLGPRVVLVILAPSYGGDGLFYETVAQNILQHGCVSLADPAVGQCTPHWGGNQLPGYPLFLATVWIATGSAKLAPLLAQSALYAAAAAYAAWSAARVFGSRPAIALTLVLALSPVLVAWPRMELTESLALAGTVWVFSAAIRSVGEQRVRWLELGTAFALGVLVRYDFALMAAPVMVVALSAARPSAVIRAAALAAAVGALPAGLWWARSVAAGLPSVPPLGLTSAGDPAPPGVLQWMGTWVGGQYELPYSVWPLVTADYTAIRTPDRIHNANEAHLIEALRALPVGAPVPSELDRQFGVLASEVRASHPWQQRLVLPLQRAGSMWSNPYASMGWPAEVGGSVRMAFEEAFDDDGVGGALQVALANTPAAGTKAVIALWRALVLSGLTTALLLAAVRRRPVPIFLTASLVFAVVRTAAFSETVLVETRYLVPAMLWIEASLALWLGQWRERAGA
jgi:4-amino-4-deoxy-L-arabinose transferase-like glycosyltransferase